MSLESEGRCGGPLAFPCGTWSRTSRPGLREHPPNPPRPGPRWACDPENPDACPESHVRPSARPPVSKAGCPCPLFSIRVPLSWLPVLLPCGCAFPTGAHESEDNPSALRVLKSLFHKVPSPAFCPDVQSRLRGVPPWPGPRSMPMWPLQVGGTLSSQHILVCGSQSLPPCRLRKDSVIKNVEMLIT